MADRADQATRPAAAGAGAGSDWAAETADTIVGWVDAVRRNTTGRAVTVARLVVYGLLAAMLGAAAMVVVVILGVRLLDVYLPDSVFGEQHTWVAHGLLGAVLVLAGLVIWRRRTSPGPGD